MFARIVLLTTNLCDWHLRSALKTGAPQDQAEASAKTMAGANSQQGLVKRGNPLAHFLTLDKTGNASWVVSLLLSTMEMSRIVLIPW